MDELASQKRLSATIFFIIIPSLSVPSEVRSSSFLSICFDLEVHEILSVLAPDKPFYENERKHPALADVYFLSPETPCSFAFINSLVHSDLGLGCF